jgi:hypothetical protein
MSDLSFDRRDLLAAALSGALAMELVPGAGAQQPISNDAAAFAARQRARRQELWSLLGDLPWDHKPAPPRLVRTEQGPGYTLEHLVLDTNGIDPAPALLLVPDKRPAKAPAVLYMHWHGGDFDIAKRELVTGRNVLPAYAPVFAEKGIVALAVDAWGFGERKKNADGRVGQEDDFKEMLWRGRVLWGMMLFDEHRALDYLASRPEVDPSRLGAFGISMGATKAWWLAALDERIKLCIDLCCLTDFEELIRTGNLSGHGVYYYVPRLLKHFQTADINELIVPRAHLSLNGRRDRLTPPAGVEKVRRHLLPLYERYGKADDCRIELFDCGHEELPEMRKLVLEWYDRHLVNA